MIPHSHPQEAWGWCVRVRPGTPSALFGVTLADAREEAADQRRRGREAASVSWERVPDYAAFCDYQTGRKGPYEKSATCLSG